MEKPHFFQLLLGTASLNIVAKGSTVSRHFELSYFIGDVADYALDNTRIFLRIRNQKLLYPL